MQISIDESDDTDGADLACPFFVERSGAHGRLEKLPRSTLSCGIWFSALAAWRDPKHPLPSHMVVKVGMSKQQIIA